MSIKRGREKLETYFETGDRPTEEEFSELITSGINQKDDEIFVDDTDKSDPKIGIGTDQPQEKLHVDGNIRTSGDSLIDGSMYINGNIHGDSHNWGILDINASKRGKEGGAYMHLIGSHRNESNGNPLSNQGGISFVGAGKGILNGFNFVHYNQERDPDSPLFNAGNVGNSKIWDLSMRITGEGKVGIGQNAPRAKLQVRGISESAGKDGILIIEGEKGHQDANLRFGIVEGSHSWIQAHGSKPLHINEAGNHTVINPNGGNVAIGTNHANNKVEIHNGPDQINGVDNDTGLQLTTGGGSGKILTSDGDGKAIWKPATTVTSGLWVDDGNGNIGNGNVGNVKVEADTFLIASKANEAHNWFPYTDGDVYITGNKNLGDKTGNIHFRSHSVADDYEHHMIVEGTGNVGIGTTTPDSKLEIEGEVGSEHGQGLLKITGKGSSKDLRFGVANDGSNPPYTWIQSYGSVPLKLNPHSAGNPTTINETTGNVGIGTHDPKRKLHINGNVAYNKENNLYFRGDDPNHGLGWFGYDNGYHKKFDDKSVNGPVLFGWSGGGLGSKRDGNEVMAVRWNQLGNVAISPDAPGTHYKLEINAENKTGLLIDTQSSDAIAFTGGNKNTNPFTFVDKTERGFRFYSVGAGNGTSLNIEANGDIDLRGNTTVNNRTPFIVKRFWSDSAHNGINTQKSTNDYSVATIAGFIARDGKIKNNKSFDFFCYTYVSGTTWMVKADFDSVEKDENWFVDVLFIRKEFSTWEGGFPGAEWND
jgi:hypothetical protein